MNNGLISKILSWFAHPFNESNTTLLDWVAGLALILIVAFLWAQFVNTLE